jgi:hypothetical protein
MHGNTFEDIQSIDKTMEQNENNHYREFIFKFNGEFYSLRYAYYSHDGIDFSETELWKVEPVETVITKYVYI